MHKMAGASSRGAALEFRRPSAPFCSHAPQCARGRKWTL